MRNNEVRGKSYLTWKVKVTEVHIPSVTGLTANSNRACKYQTDHFIHQTKCLATKLRVGLLITVQITWQKCEKSRVTVVCQVATNICGSSTQNFLDVNFMAPWILRWLFCNFLWTPATWTLSPPKKKYRGKEMGRKYYVRVRVRVRVRVCVCVCVCVPGSSVGIATELRAGWSGIECRCGRDFPPVQTGPGAYPASCTMGTVSFPGVKCGRSALLITHPLLVPRSWKSRAIPLPTLRATLGL